LNFCLKVTVGVGALRLSLETPMQHKLGSGATMRTNTTLREKTDMALS